MRREVVIAGALVAALVVPAAAADAAPDVPDANLLAAVLPLNTGAAVLPLDAGGAVHDLDIAASVTALEEEKSEGNVVTVRISSDVLFEFNQATLTAVARREIGRMATRLRGATGVVRVSGHSDSIGRPAYNLRLSQARANAVRAELQRALGGAGVRIVATGYGETRPVAPNMSDGEDNPAGRAKNRRVEIAFQTG
ncbi:MAG: OmpA family protein [Actinomadura sp.]